MYTSIWREGIRGRIQTLGGAKQSDKRQWTENDAQEVPPECEKELYCGWPHKTGWQEHLQLLHWRYSKAIWMQSCTRSTLSEQGGWTTLPILWFCEWFSIFWLSLKLVPFITHLQDSIMFSRIPWPSSTWMVWFATYHRVLRNDLSTSPHLKESLPDSASSCHRTDAQTPA